MKGVLKCVLFCIILIYSQVECACPDGYCRHSGGCYLVVGLNESWIDARSYCTVLGGALLSITSATSETATEGALRRSKGLVFPGNFWLDITDLLNPKDWKVMQRRTALTYSNWNPGDSSVNDTVSGNCVYMSESAGYKWKPAPCDSKMNFVCYSSGTRRTDIYYGYRRYNYVEEDDDIEC